MDESAVGIDARDQDDLAAAFRKGDVGLWIGNHWSIPGQPDEAGLVSSVEWLAVWSDQRGRDLADFFRAAAPDAGRMLVEVPDHPETALGTHYRLSEIYPFFYLRGSHQGADPLPRRERRIARDRKVDELSRLGASTLVLLGYSEVEQLVDLLTEEIAIAGPRLRHIVICGLPPDTVEALLQQIPAKLVATVEATRLELPQLLSILRTRLESVPERAAIKIGAENIDLATVLRTEPPIDQHFILITAQDIRVEAPEEDSDHILRHFLSGRPAPWRAFAHQLDWERDTRYREILSREIGNIQKGKAFTTCLDVPGEAGSGLTVLLQRLAYEAATLGCPAMFHRGDMEHFNYHLLRSFLTDLYQEVDEPWNKWPTVLVFDVDAVQSDSQGAIASLPRRLHRDARRAIVIRGISVKQTRDIESQDFRDSKKIPADINVEHRWLPPLSAALTAEEQEELAVWADLVATKEGSQRIEQWQQEEEVPLLVCLYFILTEDLRSAAGLGRHLTERLLRYLDEVQEKHPDLGVSPRGVLSGEALERAVRSLREYFRSGGLTDPEDDPRTIARAIIFLSLVGPMRLGLPRLVLAQLTETDETSIAQAIRVLEKLELASPSVPLDLASTDSMLSRHAYYQETQLISLRHAAYGRLILDWLREDRGRGDRNALATLAESHLIEETEWVRLDEEVPLGLLKPVLSRLPPLAECVTFAAEISTSYLRLQKRETERGLVAWQWRNINRLLEAFTWLDEQLVQQSSVILHSRGITTYKSCGSAIQDHEEWRGRYRKAVADFHRGLELARESPDAAEHPANIITSLGLLYLGWARKERDAGNDDFATEIDDKAEATLREALGEREDNPFAAYGLARFLVERCRDHKELFRPEAYAEKIAEALDLLQEEPEPYFSGEWDDIRRQAVTLLTSRYAERVIRELKQGRDELGYALEILRNFKGEIPLEPSRAAIPSDTLCRAWSTLTSHASGCARKSSFADLLRYAVFSALPERRQNPDYRKRYELVQCLVGTSFLRKPILMYDLAMLAFQVGDFSVGLDVFRKLRRGQRFFEVPTSRTTLLSAEGDPLKPRLVRARLIELEPSGRGWLVVEDPADIPGRVPFSARAFQSRNRPVSPGAVTTVFLRLDAAGPFAVPPREELPQEGRS